MRTLTVPETATSFSDPSGVPFSVAGATATSQDTRTAGAKDVLATIDWVLLENALGVGGDRLPAGRTAVLDRPRPLRSVAALPAGPEPEDVPGDPRLSAAYLDRCLNEIQGWLGIGLLAAAQTAGINRGTVYAWRERGTAPRPGTVGAILRVHGLVASAIADVGVDRTRAWFYAGDPSPLDELLTARGQAAALSLLGRRLRRSLTRLVVPPPNPLLAVTVDDAPSRPLA